jgi:hypothetical protein
MDTAKENADTFVGNYHALVTLMNTTFKETLDMWDGYVTFDDTHNLIDFAIDDVKWYDSYPDVTAFMQMLTDVQDLGYEYEFVRVGEESKDIEFRESNNHNGYLNTRTEITCYF